MKTHKAFQFVAITVGYLAGIYLVAGVLPAAGAACLVAGRIASKVIDPVHRDLWFDLDV